MINKNYIYLLLTQIIWGGAFVTHEFVVNNTPALFTTAVRYSLCAIIYVVLWKLTSKKEYFLKSRKISLKDWMLLSIMGIIGITFYITFMKIGLSKSNSASAGLIIPATQPLFSIILSVLIKKETLVLKKIIGLLLGFTGAGLIIFNKGSSILYGNLFILASALCFSIFNLASSFLSKKIHVYSSNASYLFVGSLFLFAFSYFSKEEIIKENIFHTNFLILLIYLLLITIFPLIWWNNALKKIALSTTVMFTFLIPPIALLWSILLTHHKANWLDILGSLIAMSGVFISLRPASNK